ncbi:beta-N-acetylhexosaminidase [Serpentinimonas maccroryi]|uniref:beta-N-acetylhexosaminidase n=1 Tax=Serpentinimonas maccroryi TaxID=1458426 RepID=UPI0020348A82|nr:beta-N-acetylhexosaminidase [Serpentinimonas maccroryi]MCM2479860.1 beta-N-acetylhexosaminidase [Serpentinimonas maccroryi]
MQHAPLIIDVAGTRLNKTERQRLAHPLVGGVILFGRNWESRAQLAKLCRQIKKVRPDLLICVDHEGGRVQRFRSDGFTHLPPMRALGQMWLGEVAQPPGAAALSACRAATACGYVLAAELRACGVDLSFTPVLDLDHGGSAVIGDRALGADARVVSVLAQALMHGLLQAGMRNCGKHFPGHGYVAADSHHEIPVDERSLEAILVADAAPYGWLQASLDAVMPAHVVYSQVDARPAGFSARWIEGILRQQLGFGGAVFSDDLSMAGARRLDGREIGSTEAALAALQAGCDLVLLCNQSVVDDGAPIDELIDGLSRAQIEGRWQPSALSEQRRLELLPAAPAPLWDELMVSPRYMQALSLLP